MNIMKSTQVATFEVEAARINSKISKQEVCDFLGISIVAYGKMINGKVRVRRERIVALSVLFELSEHQLLVPKFKGVQK